MMTERLHERDDLLARARPGAVEHGHRDTQVRQVADPAFR